MSEALERLAREVSLKGATGRLRLSQLVAHHAAVHRGA
jgi:hypothetical protein